MVSEQKMKPWPLFAVLAFAGCISTYPDRHLISLYINDKVVKQWTCDEVIETDNCMFLDAKTGQRIRVKGSLRIEVVE